MKKMILAMSVLMNVFALSAQTVPPAPPAAPEPPEAVLPPMPPAGPSLKVEGNTVTIVSQNGDTWVIDDMGIKKNGVLIVGDSEDLREQIDDVQAEIEEVKANPDSEDATQDLNAELAKLESELARLNTVGVTIDTLPGDSTAITIGNWRLVVKENGEDDDDVDVSFGKVPEEVDDHDVKVFDTEWFLFDMGYNTYLNADHKVQVDAPYSDLEDLRGWGSFDVNLHIFRSRVNLAHGYVNFNYGLSTEWHNYRFDRNFTIEPNMDSLTLTSETVNYDKNKFSTLYASIPLLIGFETKPWDTDNSFRMMFGYDPGLLLHGKTKQKLNGHTDELKDDFNLAQFRHEADFIIGYGDFNLYASYDVNSMFSEGEGPELHPFSVGLVIRRGF